LKGGISLVDFSIDAKWGVARQRKKMGDTTRTPEEPSVFGKKKNNELEPKPAPSRFFYGNERRRDGILLCIQRNHSLKQERAIERHEAAVGREKNGP